MNIYTKPKDPDSLDPIRLFDKDCVRSRLLELKKAFIAEYLDKEMKTIVDKAKRNFEPIPVFNWNSTEVELKYGKRAEEDALKVLETERKSYVDFTSETIRRDLNRITKRAHWLVMMVDPETGQLCKVKHIIEKKAMPDGGGTYWTLKEVDYCGDGDQERFNQIRLLNHELAKFRDLVPYMNDELKKLWENAIDLVTLEIVRKE